MPRGTSSKVELPARLWPSVHPDTDRPYPMCPGANRKARAERVLCIRICAGIDALDVHRTETYHWFLEVAANNAESKMRMDVHGMAKMAVLYAALCAHAHAAPTDSWGMYQANAGHTGYIKGHLLFEQAQSMWTVQAQPGRPSGLAVADGLVLTTPETYFDAQAELVAQRLSDGQPLWRKDFGNVFSVNQPAVQDGLIYLQTGRHSDATFLHCYSVDGTFQWRTPFDAQWERYLGPIVVDGSVYFNGGHYGGIYKVSETAGKMEWYSGLPQYDSWSPTWNDGTLLAFTNRLDIIDPESGAINATIEDPDYVWGGYSPKQAPVVVGDLAYVTNGGRLVAFDLVEESVAWTRLLSATGQVSTDGNELFMIAGGALSVREPTQGNFVWSWAPPASGNLTTNIIVTDSHVIVGDDARTYLVNRATRLADRVISATGLLAYAADTLVIADATGAVRAFSIKTDELFASAFEDR